MTNEVAIRAPEIRTLVVGKAGLEAYRNSLLRESDQAVALAETRYEEAVQAVNAAELADEPEQMRRWRAQRTRRATRLEKVRNYRKAVDLGYLPIPRLPAVRLDRTERLVPAEALMELKVAKDAGIFERFGVIDGTDATVNGWPIARRSARRDPILVGIINGEPFPLAWWR